MLIIAADRDAAPLQQAEQLFSALMVQGKDAQLLTYWGEGHAIGSPAIVADMYAHIFAWLDEYLATEGATGLAVAVKRARGSVDLPQHRGSGRAQIRNQRPAMPISITSLCWTQPSRSASLSKDAEQKSEVHLPAPSVEIEEAFVVIER